MPTKVSATEAVRTFSDLLNRIRYRGEEFVVERAGEPVCRMTPAAPARRLSLRELASLLREIPGADEDYASGVRRAAVGTLIDSSVLIAAERRTLDLDAAMVGHADEPVAIAAITASELLHGVHRAVTATSGSAGRASSRGCWPCCQ